MSSSFALGQRWVSSAEPSLGLGLVVEVSGRHVEMAFPAAEEQRSYALQTAPLSRVAYREGDVLEDGNGDSFTVLAVAESNGCLIYSVSDADGNESQLAEAKLNSHVHFSNPRSRLLTGQLDKPSRFALRYQTQLHQGRLQASPVRGLLGARAQLLPHQFYIASQVASRYAPRVLLADEVGMGKTIEAGLIIHQQLATGLASRVLIVVPDSLVHQWLVEMLRRFNLQFSVVDADRCAAMPEANVFEESQLLLCPQSLIRDNMLQFSYAMECDWDLLVVDEAHHLEWHEGQPSKAYKRVESLANMAQGLLLLTATPEQLGLEGHFARLRLLDPNRYPSLEQFRSEEQRYAPVNELVQALRADGGLAALSAEQKAVLTDYVGAERLSDLAAQDEPEQALCRELLDHHGIGRVLFRNTRASVSAMVGGFPQRRLHSWPLKAPAAFDGAEVLDDHLRPEILLGDDWAEQDSRSQWLADWLKANRQQKTLVITAHKQTAEDLEQYLSLRQGIRATSFHEGMSLVERDRAAAWFADDEAGAQVLVCSEIGSEGRNFQFAQHLVMFDLPRHPDLLEQRIGRLDRIGQQGDVNIHVPHYEASAQAGLLRWYDEGLAAFTQPFAAGDVVFQEVGEQLEALLLDEAPLDGLIGLTQGLVAEQRALLQQGRDQLVELNSCDPEAAGAMLEKVEAEEQVDELAEYMETVFEKFGVDIEAHSDDAIIARPGDAMEEAFPMLPDDGLTATYSRQRALSREDMHFLSWEHPMVEGAMDMVLSGEFGNTCFTSLKVKGLEPGSVVIETIYRLQCSAPKQLQLGRYLPQTPLRLCVDNKGRDLTKHFSNEVLNKACKAVPKATAVQMTQHARPTLETMLDQADQLAQTQLAGYVQQATEKLQQVQGGEVERLQALAKVNPNIRDEEVQAAQQALVEVQQLLAGAKLQLDAARVVLITD
jgi:ATP-dependent helicase HepA